MFVTQAWLIERGCSSSRIRRLYLINSRAFVDPPGIRVIDAGSLVNYLRAYNFAETRPRLRVQSVWSRLTVRIGNEWND